MSKAKLKKIRDSLDFTLGELAREARKQARLAQLDGNKGLQDQILERLEEVEQKRREAEHRMMVASLSTGQIDTLIAGLSEKASEARGLLDGLRMTGKVLEILKKAANLATAILGTVEKTGIRRNEARQL